jgi:hypothetical protein
MSRKDFPVDKSFYKSTNSAQDLQYSDGEDSIYEREDVTHGVNCTCCISIEESNRLDEKRRQWFIDRHKGRNERVRQKQAKARATEITAIEQPQSDTWNPLFMEDFEE